MFKKVYSKVFNRKKDEKFVISKGLKIDLDSKVLLDHIQNNDKRMEFEIAKESVKLEQKGESNININDFSFMEVDGGLEIIEYRGSQSNLIIPSKIFELDVVGVGSGSFDEAGLKNISLPNTVKYIEDVAFIENELTSIVIPDSVKEIGEDAFSLNPIKMVASIDNPVAEELAKELGVTHLQGKDIVENYKKMNNIFS